MRRTARLLLPLLLITLVLAGCTQPDPMPTPPPTPSAAPVFASDEEALGAAEEAYGKFLAALDGIFIDGGEKPERLLAVASEEVLEQEAAGFEQLRTEALRGTGSTHAHLTLQAANLALGEVVAYSCDDISDTDIVDRNGVSVVAERTTTVFEYEVVFSGDPLIVQSRLPWDGASVCE
ncbi:MAG TPA: hypothetical protein VL043_04905 [Protaetiibacter sp.]|nr:hypothetical protein [Protaetiibacter sp.]